MGWLIRPKNIDRKLFLLNQKGLPVTEDQRKALSAIGALNTLMREELAPDSPVAAPIICAAIEAEKFLKYQHFWVKMFHDPKKLSSSQYEIISMNVRASAILEEFVAYVEDFRKQQTSSRS